MFKCLEIKKAIMKGYSPSIISIIIVFFQMCQLSKSSQSIKLQNSEAEARKLENVSNIESVKAKGHLLKKVK